jgi:hypothetical protein
MHAANRARVLDLMRPMLAAKGAPPPPSRTNWTRLVPPPVLTGRVSSHAGDAADGMIVVQGGDEQSRADTDAALLFRQESNFHYLFGVEQPGSAPRLLLPSPYASPCRTNAPAVPTILARGVCEGDAACPISTG